MKNVEKTVEFRDRNDDKLLFSCTMSDYKEKVTREKVKELRENCDEHGFFVLIEEQAGLQLNIFYVKYDHGLHRPAKEDTFSVIHNFLDEYYEKFLIMDDPDLPRRRACEKVKQDIADRGGIDKLGKDGRTLLMNAIYLKDTLEMKELIRLGADINATDKKGRTVVFHAIDSEHDYINDRVDALVEAGADLTIVDNDGNNAFQYALGALQSARSDASHWEESYYNKGREDW